MYNLTDHFLSTFSDEANFILWFFTRTSSFNFFKLRFSSGGFQNWCTSGKQEMHEFLFSSGTWWQGRVNPRASSNLGSQLGAIINDFSSLGLFTKGPSVANHGIDKFRIWSKTYSDLLEIARNCPVEMQMKCFKIYFHKLSFLRLITNLMLSRNIFQHSSVLWLKPRFRYNVRLNFSTTCSNQTWWN